MTHFAILNVSASLDDLKPIHIPNALVSLRNGSIDCFLNVCFRRTDNFDYFVNMICHYCSSAVACRIRKRPAEASRFCWLCVAGARLIVRLFGIFITLARGLALLAGLLATALLLTGLLTRCLILLAGLVLSHLVSFHGERSNSPDSWSFLTKCNSH
jgi:hypothetical protein